MRGEWLVATNRHDGERVTGQQVARFTMARLRIIIDVAVDMRDAPFLQQVEKRVPIGMGTGEISFADVHGNPLAERRLPSADVVSDHVPLVQGGRPGNDHERVRRAGLTSPFRLF